MMVKRGLLTLLCGAAVVVQGTAADVLLTTHTGVFELDTGTGELMEVASLALQGTSMSSFTVDNWSGAAYMLGRLGPNTMSIQVFDLEDWSSRLVGVPEELQGIAVSLRGLLGVDRSRIVELDPVSGTASHPSELELESSISIAANRDSAYVFDDRATEDSRVRVLDAADFSLVGNLPIMVATSSVDVTADFVVFIDLDDLSRISVIDPATGALTKRYSGLEAIMAFDLGTYPDDNVVYAYGMLPAGRAGVMAIDLDNGSREFHPCEIGEQVVEIEVYQRIPPAQTIEPISAIEVTEEAIRLTIPSADRRRIGAEYSETMLSGSWVPLGNFVDDPESGTSSFVDPDFTRLGRERGYYRAFLRPSH